MDIHQQDAPDDGLFPSVFEKKNWPYAGVDEELQEKKFEGKPYGPLHEWMFQLKLNVNNNADHLTGQILLCLLNYAATHDNKIEDTRDFLGFLWWYNERIKKLPGMGDTEKRKAAYKALVYLIIGRMDYLSIDLFSPAGEIYAVSLLEKNSGISDYMSVKIKLQRLYAGIGEIRDKDLIGYLDLREIDRVFFETLADPDIYGAYIREFFLYELTPDNIGELLASPKLAVIKVPTKQTVLITPEYLCQLARISFLKLSQVFTDPDRNIGNQAVLTRVVDRMNAKNNKKYTVNFAHDQMKDPETLESEHEFWSYFLEGVTACTPEEVEGAGNLQMYAFLLGAVMPEAAEEEEGKTISKLFRSHVKKGDIAEFLAMVSVDKTADYTFASLLDLVRKMPSAEKFKGMEKDYIEESLDSLIKDGQITRIREPNPKNISHFIVTKNLLTFFYSSLEKIRDGLLLKFQGNKPANENEFRLELEKKVSSGYSVFYQLYVRKEFAANVFRMLDKMDPAVSSKYKQRLFIAAAKEPSFLPLPEILEIVYARLNDRPSAVPAAEKNAADDSGAVKKTGTAAEPSAAVAGTVPAAVMPANGDAEAGKTAKTSRGRADHPPADLLELYLLIIRKIGKFLRRIFGGLKNSMVRAIEKDLEKKNAAKESARGNNTAVKGPRGEKKEPSEDRSAAAKEIELSLQAISKNLIEDFTGSPDLSMDEAVRAMAELWNHPKTLKKDEEEYVKKENLSAINTIINNNTMNLKSRNVNEAKIMERATEISEFREVGDIILKLVKRNENKEIIKRYVALCLCSILSRK